MPRKTAAKVAPAPALVAARIVRIGNSRGVRIPKVLLEQAGITDAVTLALQDGGLLVKAEAKSRHSRAGWDAAFKAAGAGTEELLWPDDMETDFDKTEWTW